MSTLFVLGLLFLALVGAFHAWQAFRDFHFEDSYITFRYAENLAQGKGLVFNEGERVLGTSAPSWTLLLAGLGALGLPISATAGVLYALLLGLSGFLGGYYLLQRDSPTSAVLFCLAAIWGAGNVFGYWGMETALYLASILASILLASTERRRTTGLVLGLVAVTRYDGIVPVGIVLLGRWWRDRRVPWTEGVLAASILGAWLGFATWYFGSPLPQTLGAKASSTTAGEYLVSSWHSLVMLFSPLGWLIPTPRAAAEGTLVVLLLVGGVGLPRLLGRRPEAGALLAVAVALTAGYAVIGPPAGHLWYQVPSNYCLLAIALASVESLFFTEVLRRRISRALLGLALVALPLQARNVLTEAHGRTDSPEYQYRIGAYQEMAEWILRTGTSDLTLMTNEPGYLTSLTGQPALDSAGLVSQGFRFHGPVEERTQVADALEQYRPGLLVRGTRTGHLLVHDPAFEEYLPILLTPQKHLLMRRERYFDRFAAIWEAFQASPANETAVGVPSRWFKNPRIMERLERSARVPGEEEILTKSDGVPGGLAMVWSEPFRVTHEELRFELVAPDPKILAQLIVDGQLVYEVVGRAFRGQAGSLPIRWSLEPFEGRSAVLRFIDDGRGKKSVFRVSSVSMRDHAKSAPPSEILDWITLEGRPARELAEHWGLAAGFGERSISTLGRPGAQVLESPEFVLTERDISLVLHRTASSSRVALEVGERRITREAGRSRAPLKTHHWRLEEEEVGQPARLLLFDDDPDPDRGVGLLSVGVHRGLENSVSLH